MKLDHKILKGLFFDARTKEKGERLIGNIVEFQSKATPKQIDIRSKVKSENSSRVYRQHITLLDIGKVSSIGYSLSTECSCPVGYQCKHSYAALLNYIEHQEKSSNTILEDWLSEFDNVVLKMEDRKSKEGQYHITYHLVDEIEENNYFSIKAFKSKISKNGKLGKPAKFNFGRGKSRIPDDLIDFDIDIVYEDEYILVIDKPSGVTVHSAPSVKEATVVDWLKSKNISLSTISADVRHGIVHRLDKGTSGLMVVAKTNEAHIELSNQLSDKSMGRYYIALIDLPLKDDTVVEKPIGRNRKNRLKMDIVSSGKYAKSSFCKLSKSIDDKYELISAKLFTGRTHQIRVHLNSINRHILGDSLYGFKGNLDIFTRVYLHAHRLYLIHPITKQNIYFEAKIPEDMELFLNNNFDMEIVYEQLDKNNIINCFDSIH